jgi:hypothetical protein
MPRVGGRSRFGPPAVFLVTRLPGASAPKRRRSRQEHTRPSQPAKRHEALLVCRAPERGACHEADEGDPRQIRRISTEEGPASLGRPVARAWPGPAIARRVMPTWMGRVTRRSGAKRVHAGHASAACSWWGRAWFSSCWSMYSTQLSWSPRRARGRLARTPRPSLAPATATRPLPLRPRSSTRSARRAAARRGLPSSRRHRDSIEGRSARWEHAGRRSAGWC